MYGRNTLLLQEIQQGILLIGQTYGRAFTAHTGCFDRLCSPYHWLQNADTARDVFIGQHTGIFAGCSGIIPKFEYISDGIFRPAKGIRVQNNLTTSHVRNNREVLPPLAGH